MPMIYNYKCEVMIGTRCLTYQVGAGSKMYWNG